MPERQSPLQAFRHLEQKRETVGLSPAERARYEQLKAIVAPEPSAAVTDLDDAAIDEALEALSEPRAPDLSIGEAIDIAGPDSGAAAPSLDAEASGYHPGAPGQDPDAPAWNPDQPYDPEAALGDASRLEALDVTADEAAMALDALEHAAAAEGDDRAARDAGAAQPPLDRAGAFDLDAPSFDAAGPLEDGAGEAVTLGSEPAPDGAPAGSESGTLSYDLSPMAFDTAALPPEPGQGGGGREAFDTAAGASLSDLAAAEPQPEAELLEADLIEVEAMEPELVDGESPGTGPARSPDEPGADLFAAVLPAPGGSGEQPLDAAAFTDSQPATGRELEPAAGKGHSAPAGAALGGPGASDAAESPAGLDLALDREKEDPARPADEPLSPSPGETSALEDLAIDMSPVDVDLGEIDEPVGPAPAGRQPSSTFVAGEQRVLLQTVGGQLLCGTLTDVDLDSPALPLVARPGAAPEPIARPRVKAIFFMLPPGERPAAAEGRKVRVTFRDGRQVAGFGVDHDLDTIGFFLVPAESRTGTGRIWVYRAAVQRLSVS